MGKRKKKMINFWVEKPEEKRDICGCKLQGESFE